MLVKVNPDYFGMYGFFKKETESVAIKTRESAPFEEDDALSLKMIEKGVLVKADGAEPVKAVAGERAETGRKPEPVTEDKEDSLEGMSLKELKELAKDCGVSYRVGMSKAALIDEIVKAQSEEPPVLTAALPE